ncbi:MAG: GMC family oxidoreductase [Actinobacteria bacterium]|nr:GMC family oxidoreductase [Actinomycetota bacterium]
MVGHAPSTRPPVVVVGGGTAGSTVVAHLAHATDREIILVEPGASSPMDDEPRFFDVLAATDTWSLEGYTQPRVLGGGSAVNGLVLSGDPPLHVAELTRDADEDEMGPASLALLGAGGRRVRLWWNGGRWNPGRVASHLVEEGRIEHRRTTAERLVIRDGAAVAVVTATGEIECSSVVVCAGAILTPVLLLRSGLDRLVPHIGEGLQNHPTLALVFHALAGEGRFDAAVVHEARTTNGRAVLTIVYERASAHDSDIGLMMSSLMEVESRGRVVLDDGRIAFHFGDLSTPGDRIAHTEMSAMLDRLADACGFIAHGLPAPALVSHATSSCAMSVDGEGRLLGVGGVRIADASVLAGVPAVTPAAPVTMEALRIATAMGEEMR